MQNPGWYPDELAHAGDEHLDPEYVAGYDRKSNVDPSEDLALLRELGMDEASTVVDLGAGTGVFALAVAPHCGRMVAVDVSPAMLAVVTAKAEAAGVANIDVVHGGFLSYAHQGDPADFIFSRNALHHLPDFWKAMALQRVAGMLKPGGVFRLHDLVYNFDPSDAEEVIESWLSHAPSRPEDGYTRPELETHIREEFSTFTWLLEPLIERAGFEIREADHRPNGAFAAYTLVKR